MTATVMTHIIRNHEGSAWLRGALNAMHSTWETTGAHVCPHLARGVHGTVVAALWCPELLVCPECLPALAADEDEDQLCDRCRGPVHPAVALTHDSVIDGIRLLVTLGLCSGCAAREVGK